MATIDKRLADLEHLVKPTNGKKQPYCVLYDGNHMTYPEYRLLTDAELAGLGDEFENVIRVTYTEAAGLEALDLDDQDN